MLGTNRTRSHRRAFTIVEVMIVLVIIGLIGAIVGINLVGAAQKARIQTTTTTLKNIQSALTIYHGSNGSYPQSAGSLMQLVQSNTLQLAATPVDAWNREILFYSDGVNYRLSSVGPDGIEDTEDDIVVVPEHQ
jgi:general secretion pathway protein G